MPQTIPEQKTVLRSEVKRLLRAMPAELRSSRSLQACALLQQQPVWQCAKVVLFYAPLPGELDIWPVFRQALLSGKTACLPRFSGNPSRYTPSVVQDPVSDLHPGRYGILEPNPQCREIELNRLDLILVPGVAFDLHGRRLGRGKGYYDKMLRAGSGKTCGVAFDEQLVESVPIETHDVYLNCILTPTRWFEP